MKRKAVYNKEATMKYLATLKEIRFRVKPEDYERYQTAAAEMGYESMRQFYLDAIDEKIQRNEAKSEANTDKT